MLKLEGNTPEQESSASSSSFKGIDISAEVAKAYNQPAQILTQIFTSLKDNLGIGAISRAIVDLDKQSSDLVKALGAGSKRGEELTQVIADSIPKFVELGLEAGKVFETYNSLVSEFDTNLMLSDETLTNLAATTKVTGVDVKQLGTGFRDVGVGLSNVGDKMLDVVNIAKQGGVTASAVSAGVVKNLDKMNIYNFDGGVKGLAKMAVQASRLGIDMDKVFSVVDKVFNPEGAIELAAGLQRLGVSSSELLDPLRLMDLAQNDPTELQNQIVNMSKEFVRFNKEQNQFEILPGAKRRLDEIGKSMGLNNGELQKMALNASNFDAKLKQIKFSPDIKKEDRELVATMAQINKQGEAVVRVKEVIGGKETGEFIEKRASELTESDVKLLKEQQALNASSMEEIAIDQLSEMQKTNSYLSKLVAAENYGVASEKDIQKGYKGGLTGIRGSVKDLGMPEESKDYRKSIDYAYGKINDIFNQYGITLENLVKMEENFVNSISDITNRGLELLSEYLPNDITNLMGLNTQPSVSVNSIPNGLPLQSAGSTPSTSSTSTSIDISHKFDFSSLPANLTTEQIIEILKKWSTDPINAKAIKDAAEKINSGLTGK